MLNRVILIGRLTRDPELRYTPNGTAVASFTVAINRKYNREETDFIPIVVWSKQAEHCANYLGKGRLVAVEGRLQVRTYEAKDGQKRWVTEVIADDVRFLDKGGTSSGGGSEYQAKPRQDDWNDLGREVSLEDIDIMDTGAEDDEVPF
ncbi:MAG: single-stranded DNA-binding protein [Syntrophomonadaceae bacterium]|jgi:single-strand DNA-binding protein|nr:single-stranded DNA-binding protein [Syntrophomonadaceae bacterium]